MSDKQLILILLVIASLCTLFLLWKTIADAIESDFFRIYLSARRMRLRDRGMVESVYLEDGKTISFKHNLCNTRSRIGITEKGERVRWCWRCEYSFDGNGNLIDGSKGRKSVDNSAKVVKLFPKNN